MGARAESVVADFLRSWESMSAQSHAEWFAEDGVFDDVPIGVHAGRDAIREGAQQYPPTTCDVLRMVSDGDLVVVERIDRFEYGGKPFALRVVGMFEVDDDGKIAVQRDYYDMKGLLQELADAGIDVAV
jgi:limonene-1,2-epoxide hydrolase